MLAIRYNEGYFIGNKYPSQLDYFSSNYIHRRSRKLFKSLKKNWSYSCLNLAADTTRVSLAYKQLNQLPARVSKFNFYRNTQILDLTHNDIRNLSFLYRFKKLNSLILDHNTLLDVDTLPYMPNLHLLWLNNCNIMNISAWITKIKERCPNVRYLSMMENPGSSYENLRIDYRSCVISFLPMLEYLDDAAVTKDERVNALLLKVKVICNDSPENEQDEDEFITFESHSYPY